MHEIVTEINVVGNSIVFTLQLKTATKVETLMIHTMDVITAGKMVRRIADAIETITVKHANNLPEKKTILIVGRSHA